MLLLQSAVVLIVVMLSAVPIVVVECHSAECQFPDCYTVFVIRMKVMEPSH